MSDPREGDDPSLPPLTSARGQRTFSHSLCPPVPKTAKPLGASSTVPTFKLRVPAAFRAMRGDEPPPAHPGSQSARVPRRPKAAPQTRRRASPPTSHRKRRPSDTADGPGAPAAPTAPRAAPPKAGGRRRVAWSTGTGPASDTPSERIGGNYSLHLGNLSPRTVSGRGGTVLGPSPAETARKLATALAGPVGVLEAASARPAPPTKTPIFGVPGESEGKESPWSLPTATVEQSTVMPSELDDFLAPSTGKALVNDAEFLKLDLSKLPLDQFDSSDYEAQSPQGWLDTGYALAADGQELDGPLAFTPFYAGDSFTWRPCVVCGYDDTAARYLIQFKKAEELDAEQAGMPAFLSKQLEAASTEGLSSGAVATLHRDGGVQNKWVSRLNLRFAVESEYNFEQRRTAAQQRRDRAMERFRYMHFIDNMPDDAAAVAPLAPRLQKRILRRAVMGAEPGPVLEKHVDVVRGVMADARDAYLQAIKHATVSYKLLDPAALERHLGLRLPVPSALSTPVVREPDFHGTVDMERSMTMPFSAARETVMGQLAATLEPVRATMEWISAVFHTQFADRRFLDTRDPTPDPAASGQFTKPGMALERERRRRRLRKRVQHSVKFFESSEAEAKAKAQGSGPVVDESHVSAKLALLENVEYPCSLEVWRDRQSLHCKELAQDLLEEWRYKLVSELHDCLQDAHNLYQREVVEYTNSPLHRMLTRAHYFMAAHLRHLVDTSIDEYMVFLSSCCEHKTVAARVKEAFEPAAKPSIQLYEAVEQWADEAVAVQDFGESGFEDEADDIIIPFQLGGTYGWAQPSAGPRVSHRPSLFRLSIVATVGQVDFSPSVSEVKAAVLDALEYVTEQVLGFTSVEHELMHLLHLPARKLLPVAALDAATASNGAGGMHPARAACASTDARLNAARACVLALVDADMARPNTLALEYARYVWLLNEKPDTVRETVVVRRWYNVLAGWEGEAATELDQEIALGLASAPIVADDDDWSNDGHDPSPRVAQEAAGPKRRRVTDEVGEVSRYFVAGDEVQRLSHNLTSFGLVVIDATQVKAELQQRARSLADVIMDLVVEDCRRVTELVTSRYEALLERVTSTPTDAQGLATTREFLNECDAVVLDLDSAAVETINRLASLGQFQRPPPQEVFQAAWNTRLWPRRIEEASAECLACLDLLAEQLTEALEEERAEFEAMLAALPDRVLSFYSKGEITESDTVAEHAMQLQDALDAAVARVADFNAREHIFDQPRTEYDVLDNAIQDFEPFHRLWTIVSELDTQRSQWLTGPFTKLDAVAIAAQVDTWWNQSRLLVRKFKDMEGPLRVASLLKDRVSSCREVVPIIEALASSALRDWHWADIGELLGHNIELDDSLTLQRLLDMGAKKHLEAIQEISLIATKQNGLEKSLEAMRKEWLNVSFDLQLYKDSGVHIVRGVEDISALLDEQLVKTQGILSSPFVTHIVKQCRIWEQKLLDATSLLESWLACQRAWLYLEPIFGSEEIMRQMPKEGRKFAAVDALWRRIMSGVVDYPKVMDSVDNNSMYSSLDLANAKLDEIHKGLNEFLELKRLAFPRFFFLSDDNLLEILAETKDPRAVQPHLQQSFEGVNEIEFQGGNLITAMVSREGERVPFVEAVDPDAGLRKGNVELWMSDVEDAMRTAVRDHTQRALHAHGGNPTDEWLFAWPGQVVLSVSQVMWTRDVERALRGDATLADILDGVNARLRHMVATVRGDLTPRQRTTLTALVTVEVHARDVVASLVEKDVAAVDAFDWFAQMRYYWEGDPAWEPPVAEDAAAETAADREAAKGLSFGIARPARRPGGRTRGVAAGGGPLGVMASVTGAAPNEAGPHMPVRIVNAVQYYGWEYLGNTSRLVITPLTDRCYRTMMGAVHLVYGGAPSGPAGTGKTETIKDLAKAVAVHCVVFNCSDGLDYLAMAKMFKGLASSGAWACFDEFNRIELEVLSVVAGQILTVQKAKREGAKRFVLENTNLVLRPTCNVFVTMNPGYAGRSELPDNLKALFRPCAMMVPDYAWIAEIILYSHGFQAARDMARKVVQVLQLASQQLSSQRHYDYGMRAVKSILDAAGLLRRKLPWEEDQLVMRAILDANLPKFTSSDTALFRGIVSDLFPATVLPEASRAGLDVAVVEVCQATRLQPTPAFVAKCLQVHDTLSVRHGLMLVGQTMAGKTAVLRTLARALTSISVETKVKARLQRAAAAALAAAATTDASDDEKSVAAPTRAPRPRRRLSLASSVETGPTAVVGALGNVAVPPRRRQRAPKLGAGGRSGTAARLPQRVRVHGRVEGGSEEEEEVPQEPAEGINVEGMRAVLVEHRHASARAVVAVMAAEERAAAGGAGGRPLTAEEVVAEAESPMALDGVPEDSYEEEVSPVHSVRMQVVNPKALVMAALYGSFDENTHEWSDGVLALGMRQFARDASTESKWVVFDGPVDAAWVENLNTVLDDNKKLCLNSGEIIKLTPSMAVLFEVDDLASASPATVSRCGMVYLAPDQLGWRSLVRSWLDAAQDAVTSHSVFVWEVVEWLLPPALAAVQCRLSSPAPLTTMHLVASFLRLLSVFVDEVFPPVRAQAAEVEEALRRRKAGLGPEAAPKPAAGGGGGASLPRKSMTFGTSGGLGATSSKSAAAAAKKARDRAERARLEAMIVMAVVWGVGGTVDGASRPQFDATMRHLLSGLPAGEVTAVPKSGSRRVELMGGVDVGGEEVAPSRHPMCPVPDKGASVFDFDLWVDGQPLGVGARRGGGDRPPAASSSSSSSTPAAKWVHWAPTNPNHPDSLAAFTIPATAAVEDIVVPTLDTIRYRRVAAFLAGAGRHVLAVGPTGTGKSVLLRRALLAALNPSPAAPGGNRGARRPPSPSAGASRTTRAATVGVIDDADPAATYYGISLQFTTQTRAPDVQDTIDGSLMKRRVGVYGPQLGRKAVVIVDDVSMPLRDAYGSQPPLELLRQWMDHGGWYTIRADRRKTFRSVVDVQFAAAMTPSGTAAEDVPARFIRHFNVLSLAPFDDHALTRIFGTILNWFLDSSLGGVRAVSPKVVAATLDMYRALTKHMRPTPAKLHYTFNLRDLSNVFRGVAQARAADLCTPGQLVRLWAHECCRVFADRLVDAGDDAWFHRLLSTAVTRHLDLDWDDVQQAFYDAALEAREDPEASTAAATAAAAAAAAAAALGPSPAGGTTPAATAVDGAPANSLLFADFADPMSATRHYSQVGSDSQLLAVLEQFKDEYNVSGAGVPMNLVLFTSARDHICRLGRVLRQPGGHALLVGVGGSGRRSVTRLAAYIAGLDVVEPDGTTDWHDDLKDVMLKVGVEGRAVAVLLTGAYLKSPSMVEDVSAVLNGGAVPSLFTADEVAAIVAELGPRAHARGLSSAGDVFQMFLDEARRNLHVVLCFSPAGAAFRTRLRQFPALVNCCYINWFQPWPAEALHAVAQAMLVEDSVVVGSLLPSVVAVCVHMQQSVAGLSQDFLREQNRPTHVTPTSFLRLIRLFTTLLASERQSVSERQKRYAVGVKSIYVTEEMVGSMKAELKKLAPVLDRNKAETAAMVATIEEQQASADATREVVEAEEAACAAQAAAAKAMKEECETALATALPELEAANAALKTLTKADVAVVRAMMKPPPGVRLVVEAVAIMLKVKPVKGVDREGRMRWDYWEPAKKTLLNDPRFLKRLLTYRKDKIAGSVVATLQPYLDNPAFTPAEVAKASSAAEGLCKWVRAMMVYHQVRSAVEPKRKALKEAAAQAAAAEDKLALKAEQLRLVTEEIDGMRANLAVVTARKEDLEAQVQDCTDRMDRATRLIDGLGGEKERWTTAAEDLAARFASLVGDVLLAAGAVAYLGPFTAPYRATATASWVAAVDAAGVPRSDPYTLQGTLCDAVTARTWVANKLPSDGFSIDNAVLLNKSNAWPLLIDPQGQASRWVRLQEHAAVPTLAAAPPTRDDRKPSVVSARARRPGRGRQAGAEAATADTATARALRVFKASDAQLAARLEAAVQVGAAVMVTGVGEVLDHVLEPLLSKRVYRQAGTAVIKLRDTMVPYDPAFKLYLVTSLPNPRLTPEAFVKVNVLNFVATPGGLQDQMLSLVMAAEVPDAESQVETLQREVADNARQVEDLEDKVLGLLSSGQGKLLDDEELITTLSESKAASNRAKEKITAAERMQRRIQATRVEYAPVARRAANLYFCVASLAGVDAMYQFSLEWFVALFRRGLSAATASKRFLNARLRDLIDTCTHLLYVTVCQSLFERHKLLFSFLLALNALHTEDIISTDQLRFLLVGSPALDGVPPNPALAARPVSVQRSRSFATRPAKPPSPVAVEAFADATARDSAEEEGPWLSDAAWGRLVAASRLPGFEGLLELFTQRLSAFRGVLVAEDPLTELMAVLHPQHDSFGGEADEDGDDLAGEDRKAKLRRTSKEELLARMAPVRGSSRSVLDLPSPVRDRRTTPLSPSSGVPRKPSVLLSPSVSVRSGTTDGDGDTVSASPRSSARPPRAGGLGGGVSQRTMQDFMVASEETVGARATTPTDSNLRRSSSMSARKPRGGRPPAPVAVDTTPEDVRSRWSRVGIYQHLVLLRCLRPDKMVQAVQVFVSVVLGRRFLEPPKHDLPTVYEATQCHVPVVFVLSAGADPMHDLLRLADAKGFGRRLKLVSLGQKQGPIAENAIVEAVDQGTWVCLQNCHLAESWLPDLERLCESIVPERTHPDFRLWLTSMPTPAFPVSVLQRSTKLTNEPPRGLRAKMLATFGAVGRDWFEGSPRPVAFKKLFYGLVMFHALVQERGQFGAVGFNNAYDFGTSDLSISVSQLRAFLEDAPGDDALPLDALRYLVGECNYGGRVTDAHDRRTLVTMLADFYNEAALHDEYRWSDHPLYYVPPAGSLPAHTAFIQRLPLSDAPSVFGLHENATIATALRDTDSLLSTALSVQPRPTGTAEDNSGPPEPSPTSGAGSPSRATIGSPLRSAPVMDVAAGPLRALIARITGQLPPAFDVEGALVAYPYRYEQSMNTVLVQELGRFNALLSCVRVSVGNLLDALAGDVIMTSELEVMAEELQDGRVPRVWQAAAYPSLKPLGSWVADLVARVQFFQDWVAGGPPPVFWLSGFFFSQAFLTGVLQNYARRKALPIDTIAFEFDVCSQYGGEIVAPAPAGVYVSGLFLEGAAWSPFERCLVDQPAGQLLFTMPVVCFRPLPAAECDTATHRFDAPVYKTASRRGELSTTGHSTNFVVTVKLPIAGHHTVAHWVKRGAALLCEAYDY